MPVPNDELTTDELWELNQADEAGVLQNQDSVDAEIADEATSNDTPQEEAPAAVFDPEAFKRDFLKEFEETVLPRHREQWTHDVMNRTRQSQEAREKRINERLAPVLDLLKRQQAEGWVTPEDAQRQYAAAAQQVAQQEDAQAKQQTEWENRQAWLRQQQSAQTQDAQPAWVESWAQQMNNVLATSGLDDKDPELKLVPLHYSDPDPQRALALLKESVATAVAAKEKRMQTERPRKERPFVDMGTGAGAGSGNPLSGIEDTDELWRLAQSA